MADFLIKVRDIGKPAMTFVQLRQVLKALLRSHDMRCLSIEEIVIDTPPVRVRKNIGRAGCDSAEEKTERLVSE